MEKQPDTLPALVTETPSRGARRHQLWLWMGIALLALLAVLLVQQRVELSALRADVAARFAEDKDIGPLARTDHQALQNLQEKIETLETTLVEVEARSAALDAAYQDVVRGHDERLLADVEQTIAIAVQQLQLGGNVEAALMGLQAADARLATSAHSRFLPLRRLITRDIERLRALPVADPAGLSLKIESVVAVVDTLPLAFEHRPAADPGAKSKSAPTAPAAPEPGMLVRAGQEIWRELRSLVRIERMDQGAPDLLTPQQSYFLRENLRLHLLSTRIALVQRDTHVYRESLRQVRELLERYFDASAKPVQGALATIKTLAELDPAVPLPALTETLNAARTLKPQRVKTR
jgi:uroporphyrin-3 C-methyltransferase